MALENVAGDYGEALRVTDTGGGCISVAQTDEDLSGDFTGPEWSLGFAFRAINTGGTGNGFLCQAGFGTGDVSGANILGITVEKNNPDMEVVFSLNTTSCGEEILHSEPVALDTNWHTAALTYDEAGDWHAYVDGAEVAAGAAPCPDLAEDFDASTNFQIWGSTLPGVEIFYVDEAWSGPGVAPASQIQDIHENGLAAYV